MANKITPQLQISTFSPDLKKGYHYTFCPQSFLELHNKGFRRQSKASCPRSRCCSTRNLRFLYSYSDQTTSFPVLNLCVQFLGCGCIQLPTKFNAKFGLLLSLLIFRTSQYAQITPLLERIPLSNKFLFLIQWSQIVKSHSGVWVVLRFEFLWQSYRHPINLKFYLFQEFWWQPE